MKNFKFNQIILSSKAYMRFLAVQTLVDMVKLEVVLGDLCVKVLVTIIVRLCLTCLLD